MHRWRRLRIRILEEASKAVAAGHLDAPDDVFSLRDADLMADPSTWRDRVAARRLLIDEARGMDLPTTASRDAITAAIARSRLPHDGPDLATSDTFHGIGLGSRPVVGTAVRVSELAALLAGKILPTSPILVAATLKPSWAIVFPKFAAVVVELGGELSHASILLREAGIPAVINASGSFRFIADGDTLRVDPVAGTVRIEPGEVAR
jgi:phosphohistidine swiveling domain-containing protein